MEKTYKTTQVANMIGIHPNTVRLYETLGLISAPIRLSNGYRVFTDLHIEQLRLARTAFQVEILQNGLRKQMTSIIKLTAELEFEKAILQTQSYIKQIQTEQRNAEEAIRMAELIAETLPKNKAMAGTRVMTRQEVSDYLEITMDTLRNWEMNGLLEVKRRRNGYRIYTDSDIMRLKIIRSLRCANYSLSAILRMMNALTEGESIDFRKAINTPQEDETIISVCDKLLTSLEAAKVNAQHMQKQLKIMSEKFS